jgi:hypothetical protein
MWKLLLSLIRCLVNLSRGLGVEQRNILAAAASRPSSWWRRMELQQVAWGGRRRLDYDLTVPEGSKPRRWVKNVKWWRDGKALTEGNFTRALLSLEKRGLLKTGGREKGYHTRWMITEAGLARFKVEPENPWAGVLE